MLRRVTNSIDDKMTAEKRETENGERRNEKQRKERQEIVLRFSGKKI